MQLHHRDLIQSEISLIPLIDVCLVLFIILLVVAPMIRVAMGDTAQHPGTVNGRSVLAIEEPQLAVQMEADGVLYVDGRRVSANELHAVLSEIWKLTPNRPVIVKGDRRLRYEQVRWVLQSVNAAGFRRAGLTAAPHPAR